MADKTTYARASEHVKGIGESLEKIAEKDVLLHSFTVSERSMRGEPRTFVAMQISTIDDPANQQMFHAWSDSLAEKLSDLPGARSDDNGERTTILTEPLLIAFERVATSGGFRVWSFK